MAGKIISLEGIDGAGKTTLKTWLMSYLRHQGIAVEGAREPGGTVLGEQLRHLLLTHNMSASSELMLMFAARLQLIQEVIEPHLKQETWVVLDRFLDSSYTYQVCAGEASEALFNSLAQALPVLPALSIFLDLPVELGLERCALNGKDRFESKGIAYFEKVRAGYQHLVTKFPQRMVCIDATQSIECVQQQVKEHVDYLCKHGYILGTR